MISFLVCFSKLIIQTLLFKAFKLKSKLVKHTSRASEDFALSFCLKMLLEFLDVGSSISYSNELERAFFLVYSSFKADKTHAHLMISYTRWSVKWYDIISFSAGPTRIAKNKENPLIINSSFSHFDRKFTTIFGSSSRRTARGLVAVPTKLSGSENNFGCWHQLENKRRVR